MLETGRTWNSTCGDCIRFEDMSCDAQQTGKDKDDSIAAVCRHFKSKEQGEKSNGSQLDAEVFPERKNI